VSLDIPTKTKTYHIRQMMKRGKKRNQGYVVKITTSIYWFIIK
jgi:hypothetical protein